MATKRTIFVSYSRADSRWLDRLKVSLAPLLRGAELTLWSDTDIQPSANWHAEIQTAITDSDAAVLLISPDFLASAYVISNELPQILTAANERGLKIFPVIVSSSYLGNSPLRAFEALNSWPLPSTRWAELSRTGS